MAHLFKNHKGIKKITKTESLSDKEKDELKIDFINDEDWQIEVLDFLKLVEDEKQLKDAQVRDSLKVLCGFFLDLYRFNTLQDKLKERTFLNYAYSVKTDREGKFTVHKFFTNFLHLYFLTQFDSVERQNYRFLSTFLLTVYNLDAVGSDGRPLPGHSKDLSTRICARVSAIEKNPSVFHDNQKLNEKRAMNIPEGLLLKAQPFFQVAAINSATRDKVITKLLRTFSRQVYDYDNEILVSHSETLLRMLYRYQYHGSSIF